MDFAADLQVFFDTGDFAVAAGVIEPNGSSAVATIEVILGTPLQDVAIFESAVEAGLPAAACRTDDLPGGFGHNWKLETEDGAQYVVVGREDDGTGVTTLSLRKR